MSAARPTKIAGSRTMRAAYGMIGAAAAVATRVRALSATGESAGILRERQGLWDGHGASGRPWVWIHAASVGEADMAVALANALAGHRPELRLVVSTMTATGRSRVAKESGIESRFFPLDFGPYVRRVIEPAPPALFVAVETEIWPETLRQLQARHVPTVVVNARLSDRSLPRYRRVRSLIGPVVEGLAAVCARDEEAAARWREIGARDQVTQVTGNLKFDLAVPRNLEETAPLLLPGQEHPVLLAASTHEGEEAFACEAFMAVRERFAGARLLLAPRHPRRSTEAWEAARSKWLAAVAWSDVVGIAGASKPVAPAIDWPPRVDAIVLDRLGLLRAAYASSAACYVGGSLEAGPGGHNLLEPAMALCPTACGPHLENVGDQVAAIEKSGTLRLVRSCADLSRFWMEALEKPDDLKRRAGGARAAVLERAGALGRTVERLLAMLPPRGDAR